MSPSRQRTVRKLHRWLGIFFSLSALLSSGSGVLHNIMTRTQSPPPPARPAGGVVAEQIKITPIQAINKIPKEMSVEIQGINIRTIGGRPWYQILIKGKEKPVYINGESGLVDEEQDAIYAQEIASSFIGKSDVRQSEYLTRFNREYLNIFRILPVYRFDIEDGKGTRLYVSSLTGSVTRHTDNRRQWEANMFSNFHKMAFIGNKDIRDLTLTIMTLGIFVVSLLGLILFSITKG